MPLSVPRYTINDLASFPDDGSRYELLDGILLVTPAAGMPHQTVLARLTSAINVYLNHFDDATAFSPGVIEVEPGNHLEPDLLVVPNTEVPRNIRDAKWTEVRKWWLAVEVSGIGSDIYDRDFKGPAYIAMGVLEYWRVDLRDCCLYVSRLGGPSEEPHREQVAWQPPSRSEPLLIRVPELFR